MLFEFQREIGDGWEDVGIARTARYDMPDALRVLLDRRGGSLPSGRYRFRVIGAAETWRTVELGRDGRFIDR